MGVGRTDSFGILTSTCVYCLMCAYALSVAALILQYAAWMISSRDSPTAGAAAAAAVGAAKRYAPFVTALILQYAA